MHTINRSLLALLATLSVWGATLGMNPPAEVDSEPMSFGTRCVHSGQTRQNHGAHNDAEEILNTALQKVPADDRDSVAAASQKLMRVNMDGRTISQIIYFLQRFPAEHRDSFVHGCNSLIPANASNHDQFQIMTCIRTYAPRENIGGYCRRIQTQLEIDMDVYGMTEGERFARTIQLIETPNSFFSHQNINTVAQEALMAQRAPIYDGYQKLSTTERTSSLMVKTLPSFAETPEAFEAMVDDMTEALNNIGGFKAKTALTGLMRLAGRGDYLGRGIRADFNPGRSDLPTIQQLAVQLYALCKETSVEDMIKSNIVIYFSDIQNMLPKTAGHYETAGEFMQQKSDVVQTLIRMAQGQRGALPVAEKPQQSLARLVRLLSVQSLADRFNPMIEGLFMSMRGHNTHLMHPAEPNNQACTDGVYLNLMREMATTPAIAMSGVDSGMQAVTTVDCAESIN